MTYGPEKRSVRRAMLGVSLRNQIRNEEIRRRTKVTDIAQRVAKLKWQWSRHIARRTDGRWGHMMLEWRPRNETLGPWGPEARALFKELSKWVIESTGDPRAGSYLGQRISLAIQRGNAASILVTVPRCGGFEDVLDFI
ncbi:jg17063 [Pararge aegeria aegeria]|uniref:Jg17063 protein n=1 Tax=Pararge aegeria aegeria TaxID=348720 RepID=A0A8S4R0Y1_9NEOP|nr:jg17063 [Pararge aegeria aegeria]